MMKEEFEQLIGKEVEEVEYKVIEKVYTWHPAIKEVEGKKQIAMLFTNFGMSVIRGMVEVADYLMHLDSEKRELEKRMQIIKKREAMLVEGDTTLEKTIARIEAEQMKAEDANAFYKKVEFIADEVGDELVSIALKILDIA